VHTSAGGGDLAQSILIRARPEPLFSAWTEPHHLARWYADRARGSAEPGRTLHLFWDSLGVALSLGVVTAEPARRLVLERQTGTARQRQEVRLHPAGSDTTEVTIVHSGLDAAADEWAGSQAGWRSTLCLLRLYAEHCFGRQKSSLATAAAVRGRPADLFPGLRTLLLGLDLPEREPAEAALHAAPDRDVELLPGSGLRGLLLAHSPPHELLVACPALDAAVRARLIQLAGGGAAASCLLAVQLLAWHPRRPEITALGEALQEAVQQLVSQLTGRAGSA
jgi:uncharacterized protein YndB with AHSA1/START domain